MKIEIKNVSYIYNQGNPYEKKALDSVNLEINTGEFIGIIGHTGSGKSTLVQHLNGLMVPTSGNVIVGGIDTKDNKASKIDIRKNVGLVFQYPEHQLFEETIYKDIAFGPKNLGCTEEEIEERVKWACDLVGLDFENMKDESPFELSGGQKRRVAIAGVVAMKPKFLVLDEPTAGLDPKGRDEILDQVKMLHEKEGITVILVSHSMEDVAKLVDRLIVMDDSKVFMDGSPREVFSKKDELKSIGLGIPQVMDFMIRYKEMGHDISTDVLTVEEAYEVLSKYLREGKDVR
ncbi:MAG TPA: energy-coupling factor transporter ATPase [Tissierellaceae bacterium]|nr:energy-coupling factor transporter ATPase [Tissierellaceae bacterium]